MSETSNDTTQRQDGADNEPGTVVVVGGTGKTGRRVVARLRVAGVPVRAASRSGATHFDWTRPDTWPPVLDGAAAVYLAVPEEPVPVEDLVGAAVAAGVGRIVALSGRGGPEVWGSDFGAGMGTLERAVRQSGVEWTIMRANNFNQNFDEYAFRAGIMAGELALPIGDMPEPFIDVEDIAAVATTLLTTDGHDGQIYEMSGPRALTFAEATDTIARASGRRIRFRDVSPQEYEDLLVAAGATKELAREAGALFDLMRQGLIAEPATGVRQVLGREPTDFVDYAVRAAAAGAWSAP